MNYPKPLQDLIDALQSLPGVGVKTAERYAMHSLEMSDEELNNLSKAFLNVNKNIEKCPVCGNLSEESLCNICQEEDRNKAVICIVEDIKDLYAMEKSGSFKGVYHVLDGLIAPNKGVLPDDLNIDSLLDRIETVDEIIIATNLTVEGETTSLYLIKLLSSYDIKISRIAHGLPVGGHINYADDLTITKALEGRRDVNE